MPKDIILDLGLIKRESDFFSGISKLGLLGEDEISQRTRLELLKDVEPDTEVQKLREQLSMHEELRQGKSLTIPIS